VTKRPDHKRCDIIAMVESKEKPDGLNVVEKSLYAILSGKSLKGVSPDVVRAHEIFSREFKREIIEALLLVGAEPFEAEEILRIPTGVTEAYRALFFDPDVFEDDLDIIDYAKSIPHDTFGGELKQYAVDLGKECLKIRLARGSYSIDAGLVFDGVRSTAYMMTQLARINRADSSLANAALRWAQISLRAVPDEEQTDKSSIEKLQLALETRDDTTNAEKSGIPISEILH